MPCKPVREQAITTWCCAIATIPIYACLQVMPCQRLSQRYPPLRLGLVKLHTICCYALMIPSLVPILAQLVHRTLRPPPKPLNNTLFVKLTPTLEPHKPIANVILDHANTALLGITISAFCWSTVLLSRRKA